VESRRVSVALVLPAGLGDHTTFFRGLASARPAVELLHHPLSEVESQWAEGVFTELYMRRLAGQTFGTAAAAGRPFEVRRGSLPDTSHLPFNAYAHSFCGMTLQYLLFWGMESGLLLLRERQRGLWRRFRAAPVGVPAVLAGKLLSTAVIAVLQIAVTFAVGRLVFGVTVTGSWLAFAALALAAALLSAATGLLVAAVGGTEARARSVCVLVILSVSMLGGLWVPSFLLPSWVQGMALALPTSWAMRGLDGVTWQGLGWSGAAPCVAAVLGFSAAFLVAAAVAFTRAETLARRGECYE
jgi:ABC-2 type transport system permease protein